MLGAPSSDAVETATRTRASRLQPFEGAVGAAKVPCIARPALRHAQKKSYSRLEATGRGQEAPAKLHVSPMIHRAASGSRSISLPKERSAQPRAATAARAKLRRVTAARDREVYDERVGTEISALALAPTAAIAQLLLSSH